MARKKEPVVYALCYLESNLNTQAAYCIYTRAMQVLLFFELTTVNFSLKAKIDL